MRRCSAVACGAAGHQRHQLVRGGVPLALCFVLTTKRGEHVLKRGLLPTPRCQHIATGVAAVGLGHTRQDWNSTRSHRYTKIIIMKHWQHLDGKGYGPVVNNLNLHHLLVVVGAPDAALSRRTP